MIEIFTRKDLERAVEAYIKHREVTGLSRDTAKFGAIEETVQAAQLRAALIEEGALRDTQTALVASKRQTDKLNPKVNQ